MLSGEPASVGLRLADLVVEHRPTSIGLAIISDDLHTMIRLAAEAFAAMSAELEERT